MATDLSVFNRALDLMGGRQLSSTGEDRESARVLTAAWVTIEPYCLEQALWSFSLDAVSLSSTTLPSVDFGYTEAFTKPTDVLHTYMLSADGTFKPPLQDVVEIDGVYLCNSATLFMLYASSDFTHGGAMSGWPEVFAEYAAHYLAATTCYRLTRNLDLAKVLYEQAGALLNASKLQYGMTSSTGLLQRNERIIREFNIGDMPAEAHPFRALPSEDGQ